MADKIRRVEYYYVQVPDRPGEGLRVLGKLKESGVNLLSFTAFPIAGGRAPIDLVPDKGAALTKAAKAAGLALSPKKQAFFIQGKDRIGAVAETSRGWPTPTSTCTPPTPPAGRTAGSGSSSG